MGEQSRGWSSEKNNCKWIYHKKGQQKFYSVETDIYVQLKWSHVVCHDNVRRTTNKMNSTKNELPF